MQIYILIVDVITEVREVVVTVIMVIIGTQDNRTIEIDALEIERL